MDWSAFCAVVISCCEANPVFSLTPCRIVLVDALGVRLGQLSLEYERERGRGIEKNEVKDGGCRVWM